MVPRTVQRHIRKPIASSKKKETQIDRPLFIKRIFFVLVGIISVRLFSLMILQHGEYKALAEGQHILKTILVPERGRIYVQDPQSESGIYAIADSEEKDLIYSVPEQVKNPEEVATKIAPILGMKKDDVLEKVSKPNDRYEPLLHKASEAQVEAARKLELTGIYFSKENWRVYPEKNSTAHLTGFLGFSADGTARVGQYGIEQYFNESLAGVAGYLRTEKDGAGRWITIGERILEPAKDGYDVVLTIDKNIQYVACSKLQTAVNKHGAKKGSVIIMNPKTGAVLALCNYPDYDPNEYSDANIESYFNSAVSEEWEPGSVFKTFSLGAAIDNGKITPNTVYHDSGCIKVGNYPAPICNSDRKLQNRDVDMNFVLAESLNTGSTYAVQQIGNEVWYEYVKNLGFGKKTDIELSGESAGSIKNIAELKDIYSATSSFGQGILVTPLQLITGYAAVANGGALMKPYIVEKITNHQGVEKISSPQKIRTIFSPQTAQVLSAMLVNVVDKGHSKQAAVKGYFIAAKTGTAQIAKAGGAGYDETRHNDTLVGFGPITDPAFIMLTKINEPKDVPWAEGSAAPLFGEIADWLVDYLKIPPDRPTEK